MKYEIPEQGMELQFVHRLIICRGSGRWEKVCEVFPLGDFDSL